MTSHDVVYAVRRRFPKGTKVGHLGTLDPAAAGVLPVAVGWATRLISHLPEGEKAYLAEIQFGLRSPTLDAASPTQPGTPPPQPLQLHLLPQLAHFQGTIQQVPPQVSALRQEGRRAYDRARAGEEFELPARPATYHEVEWVRGEGDRAVLRVRCGPGTYIRALARDLGESLGCGAILSFLLRLQSGPFVLAESHTLEELQASHLLPWHWPWRHLPWIPLQQWPPPPLREGSEGLAQHPKGMALYREGRLLWCRDGA